MKHLKKSTKELIFYSALALLVLGGLIYLSTNTKVARPVVGTLALDNNLLTFDATTDNEEHVYCITRKPDFDTCTWENSREFTLEDAGVYYLYVKGIKTGLVSAPREFSYQKIDYTKLRI